MYEVILINDNKEIYLNIVSTDINVPRCTGKIKQGINSINSFTLTISANNKSFFEEIMPKKTRVKVINIKNGKIEFNGRVLESSKLMDSDGTLSKQFICEDSLGYLQDSVMEYGEYHDLTIKQYLQMVIEKHNNKLEDYKRFILRNVDNTLDNNDSLYRYTSYSSTWNNINDDLIGKLGGELQVIYDEVGQMYLDYVKEIGHHSNVEIRLGYNLKNIQEDIDLNDFPTRIIPLGAKLKKTIMDEEGNESEEVTEERLTIKSINNNVPYLENKEAIKTYGISEGYVQFDDVETAAELLRKGQEYLNGLRIAMTNKISALDLNLLGLEEESFEVGNYYRVIHNLLNIDYEVRVVEKEIDIANVQETTITLGEKELTLSEQLKMSSNKNYDKINSDLNKKMTIALNTINKKLDSIEDSTNSYVKLINYEDDVKKTNEKLEELENKINTLEGGTTNE